MRLLRILFIMSTTQERHRDDIEEIYVDSVGIGQINQKIHLNFRSQRQSLNQARITLKRNAIDNVNLYTKISIAIGQWTYQSKLDVSRVSVSCNVISEHSTQMSGRPISSGSATLRKNVFRLKNQRIVADNTYLDHVYMQCLLQDFGYDNSRNEHSISYSE